MLEEIQTKILSIIGNVLDSFNYAIDQDAIKVQFNYDLHTLNVDWIPCLHYLSHNEQIEIVCKAYDLDSSLYSFSFDSQGFMTIRTKKHLSYAKCSIIIGKDGVFYE